MDWARILAYVTRTVDQELLARNEYLTAENRIMKVQLNGRLKLSNVERGVLGEIGHRLGRKVLADVATIADRALSWAGIASLLPASSMARRPVEARADLGSSERSSS
jgi:putative transposase